MPMDYQYTQVSAIAMLAYEWALTIDMEINLVWKKPWNLLKAIYLFQRYIVVLDCILALYRHVGSEMTDTKCNRLKPAVMSAMVLGTLTSEAILTIRVWAIWDRHQQLGAFLCLVAVAVWAPGIVTLYLFFADLRYAPAPIYEGFRGCFPMKTSRYIIWWWAALCIWDFGEQQICYCMDHMALANRPFNIPTVCLALVLKPAVHFFRSNMRSRLPLSLVVYRDGILFYIFLFLCSLLNVVSYAAFPLALRIMGTSLTRCLHSMLASRALLQMRQELQRPTTRTSNFFPSALQHGTTVDTIALTENDRESARN
ncbi:hypothetical protein JR316_0008334 [Psilocybe cubensis]|uniref:Uncharacterized protein n=1 Tax=Psilocybe cubensis TaxID=181762 RepID=A0ACB8GVV7_PSICU|nr:hypothetical protein JR316_0008334 [Psilocybe cubensis]KAH9479739.1 hypothetical protein JR316_0008334 [Psilocybe cubensis]